MTTKYITGIYEEYSNLTDREKHVLYIAEITTHKYSFCSNIGPLKVEYLINEKGQWAYRIYTHERTILETSPNIIESKFVFWYDSKAKAAAEKMTELYWMACNKND